MENQINKRDLLLIAGILAVAGVLFCLTQLIQSRTGQQVVITVDGAVYGSYALSEDQEIQVNSPYGTNVVVIEDGSAYMKGADCPDGYCKRQKAITRQNQTIICLPHKLIVKITEEDAKDAQTGGQPDMQPQIDAVTGQ